MEIEELDDKKPLEPAGNYFRTVEEIIRMDEKIERAQKLREFYLKEERRKAIKRLFLVVLGGSVFGCSLMLLYLAYGATLPVVCIVFALMNILLKLNDNN